MRINNLIDILFYFFLKKEKNGCHLSLDIFGVLLPL